MSKFFIPLACGTLLTFGWLNGTTARAEAVPEVTAARVIDLAPSGSEEKPPVVSSVALDRAGKTLAAVGDDHDPLIGVGGPTRVACQQVRHDRQD